MNEQANGATATRLAGDDTIADLLTHPAFAGFSRLLLPWDDRTYDGRMRLQRVGSLLPYHSHVDVATVICGLNHIIEDVNNGRTVFYDLYTDEDIASRIIYVEASRGCPFTCEFCLSSLDIPVRAPPRASISSMNPMAPPSALAILRRTLK